MVLALPFISSLRSSIGFFLFGLLSGFGNFRLLSVLQSFYFGFGFSMDLSWVALHFACILCRFTAACALLCRFTPSSLSLVSFRQSKILVTFLRFLDCFVPFHLVSFGLAFLFWHSSQVFGTRVSGSMFQGVVDSLSHSFPSLRSAALI